MKFKQLSIFLENRPGRLYKACQTLADAGINLDVVTLADTEHFGILRVLTKDLDKALAICKEAGAITEVTEVIAVQVPDVPGGLAKLLAIFKDTDINIEYMYGFNAVASKIAPSVAVMILRVDATDKALALLQAHQATVLCGDQLFQWS